MKKVLIFTNRTTDSYTNACKYVGINSVKKDTIENLDDYDGLILTGGGDIDPSLYGQSNIASRGIEEEFDKNIFYVLDYFVKKNQPILGICKGMQIINVYFKGTLVQDIKNHDFPDNDSSHKIIMLDNTFDIKKCNSYHHQCVDKLGDTLKTIAISDDNVPEIIINDKKNIIGVQFHPELLIEKKEGFQIFNYFKNLL